uniref:AIG1-type G domain-containing protein n=1 Tax=Pundamilia nyererei TaxID=303518 RepID=A0A3B4HBZ6_9CICH
GGSICSRGPGGASVRQPRLCQLRLVLVGKTGVGKSSSGNTILGKDVFRAATGSQQEKLFQRTISVVDTPGLFDTTMSEDAVKREISKCINMSAPGPHAILLVIRVGPFSAEERDAVKKVEEIFGEGAWRYTMILFTHGDKVKAEFDRMLKTAGTELQEVLRKAGNRYHVFNNLRANDRGQVLDLLKKVDKMVADNGGEFYSNDTYLQVEERLKQRESELREFYEKKLKEEIKAVELKRLSVDQHLGPGMAQSPDPDLTVFLMGRSGVGKSASGNTILGRAAFELSESWEPMTMRIQEETEEISGKLIRVIDTPGIERSKEELKTFCQGLLQSSTPLLFLVLVTTGRFTDEEEEAVQAAITVLGDEGLANSFLLFIGGDELNVSLQDHISQSKRSPLQDVVKKFGDRYHLFNNEEPEDKRQVGELLMKIQSRRYVRNKPRLSSGFSIVLLGNTAVGKSASANTILGRAAFESRASLKAVTTGIGEETGQRFGKRITVFDTPGLLGSEELIEKYYLGLPRSSTPVLLSLVVVRVGRFTEEDRRAVETAIRVLGPRRFENSYLLFTGGDALKDKSLQDFVSEDEAGPLHQVVQRFAGRTHLFNNEGGGREQVRELLQKAGNLHSFLEHHLREQRKTLGPICTVYGNELAE